MIYKNIDIINSLYGSADLAVSTLMPNRFYDALIYKKPLMVSPNTYPAKIVQKNNLGFVYDYLKEDYADQLRDYINSFDEKNFCSSADRLLREIINEQNLFLQSIYEFVKA